MPEDTTPTSPAQAKSGEGILHKHLTEVHGEVSPNTMFDPTMIIGIIVALFELIRGCRNQGAAKNHVLRGSAIAENRIYRTLRRENYPGDARLAARKLAARGTKLTDEDIQAVLDEAKDLPQPPPEPGGIWPLWVLLCFGLLGTTAANAELWPSHVAVVEPESTGLTWPPVSLYEERIAELERAIAEQNALMMRLLVEKAELAGKVQALEALVPGSKSPAAPASATPVQPGANKTGICRCGGRNHAACYCLKRGVACGCHATKGSEWNLDAAGRPINKTGRYFNPRARADTGTPNETLKPELKLASAQPAGRYEMQRVCVGGRCTWQRVWRAY